MKVIRHIFVALSLMTAISVTLAAQDKRFKDYREVYRDTTTYVAPTQTKVERDTTFNPMQIVTNKFGKNWFLFATGGVHAFIGDYSGIGKFSGLLSPDWGIGVGKWFTPGVALKVEFIQGSSRGYTEYLTGHYGIGDILLRSDGNPYRKMKTGWWDISAGVMLNLSRLIKGYEGYMSHRLMNQFMINASIGAVHHTGFKHSHGSDNEWSAHLELQYSRFFTPRKHVSFDLKARGIFYQSNFDLEYGQANHAALKWDCNVGLNVGFTFYLGKSRSNAWKNGSQTVYTRDFRERNILVVKEKETEVVKPIEYKVLTFYVFYPNNYSGRNDAPQIADAPVNAIDYLAGGIYTQKEYDDNGDVASRLLSHVSLSGLASVDIPTEKADTDFDVDYIPRGYEMSKEPLSLSLEPDDMIAFREMAGFFYAPIYDGHHMWEYRVDDATLGQQLLSRENYRETESDELNAHRGLDILRKRMDVAVDDELVSFADVYAAMNSNKGYISQFTSPETVAHVKDVIENGTITMIQAEGIATSQDNYTGAESERVALERNTALSQNRAQTVISWLKTKEQFGEVASQIYMVNSLQGSIHYVGSESTRGLDAKLNRCVKIRIHYMTKGE